MVLDLKKCLDASLLPLWVVAALGVILQLTGVFMQVILQLTGIFIPAAVAYIVALLILIADLVVLAWVGYRAVKEQGMDFQEGTTTGTIAGAIAGLVNQIIRMVFIALLVGIGPAVLTLRDIAYQALGGIGAGVLGIAVIIGLGVVSVIGAVGGAIFGAIGAYIAGRKK